MAEISIIIPISNVELYRSQCIESILLQSFTDFELILIDDGSLDQRSSICDSYASNDSRITVIHTENSGVSSAHNTDLDHATGKYITFCDSDDS